MEGPRRYQPAAARRIGWLAAALALTLPLGVSGFGCAMSSFWAAIPAGLGVEALFVWLGWARLRPASTVDLRTMTLRRHRVTRTITGVSAWGSGPREGWVAVQLGTANAVVFTEPEEARPLFEAIARSVPYSLNSSLGVDGCDVRDIAVRGRSGAGLPLAGAAAGTGWLLAATLGIGLAFGPVGLAPALFLAPFILGPHVLLGSLASVGFAPVGDARVTLHGARLEVHGIGSRRLDLRGDTETDLSHDGDGARLEVRSGGESLAIRGGTVALSAVQRAIQAIRPREGSADDVPSSLRQVRAMPERP